MVVFVVDAMQLGIRNICGTTVFAYAANHDAKRGMTGRVVNVPDAEQLGILGIIGTVASVRFVVELGAKNMIGRAATA